MGMRWVASRRVASCRDLGHLVSGAVRAVEDNGEPYLGHEASLASAVRMVKVDRSAG
jgi:hypothetical protein